MVRILIIDDHPLFCDALKTVVSRAFDAVECVVAHRFDHALTAILDEDDFDLILLDLYLPGVQGFSGLLSLRRRIAETPIVIVSGLKDASVVRQAMTFGVGGFLHKSASEEVMARALRTVLQGDTYFPEDLLAEAAADGGAAIAADDDEGLQTLTQRQLTALCLMGEGKSNKQIARELNISQETVKVHISAILRKLKVSSRTEAVVVAHRLMNRQSAPV